MGISQLLTDSISKLTLKFQCKNCLYPPGSVEHTTQWLLSLLPCQGTVTQSHTFCSDTEPWEAQEGPARCPFTTASGELQPSCERSSCHMPESQPNPLCQSCTATAAHREHPWQSPEQPAPHTDTPPLTASARHIYLPGQEEEGMKLLPCCSTGTCGIPQHQPSPPAAQSHLTA